MPQLGWAIGAAIGNAVDPEIIKGPGIGDISQQTSQEGGPRPIVFALSQPIAGNIIATSEPRIVKKRSSGKGGPKVETQSVFRTYAIGVCEGAIVSFVRVWRNGIMVYDARAGSTLENSKFLEKARFFLGTFDQNPSPDLEAIFGVGTTPAHRGTAYLVMADDDLTDLRGSIPQYTFQVSTAGTNECEDITAFSNEVLFPWGNLDNVDPRNACNEHAYRFGEDGGHDTHDNLAAALADAETNAHVPLSLRNDILGFGPVRGGVNYNIYPQFHLLGGAAIANDYVSLSLWFSIFDTSNKLDDLLTAGPCEYAHSGEALSWGAGVKQDTLGSGENSFSYGHGVWDYPYAVDTGTFNCSGIESVKLYPDWPVVINRVTRAPDGLCHGCGYDYPASELPGYCIDPEGNFIRDTGWVLDDTITWKVLKKYHTDSGIVLQYPLNPARPTGHAQYDDQAFWEAAYDAAVAAGDTAPGQTYGVDYPQTQGFGYRVDAEDCLFLDGVLTLQAVVTQICHRAGLTQIDVSQLEGNVRGFTVTNQYPAYASLKALSDVFLFDPSPRDGVVHFIPRGLNTVMTILDEEMIEDSDDAEEVDKRADGISIPRVMHLNYYDIAGGISTDKQSSERAGDRRAVGEASLSTAVIMNADEAAKVVVINHKVGIEDAKGEIRLSLPDTGDFLKLTTADAVFVQRGAKFYRCRITKCDIQDGYQEQILLRDRQSAYTSEVEGIPAVPATPPPSSLIGPTITELLDVHILQDADDAVGLGYYIALSGLFPGWQGALVELSRDGGATYPDSKAITTQAILGVTTTVLADHPQAYPDADHTVRVKLRMPDDELEDTDFVGLLNRDNLAIIGDEIVQFQEADEVEPRVWELSYLVRGRKGTQTQQWPIGTRFVLLDRSTLTFAPAGLTDLGKNLTFRVTSIGTPPDTGSTKTMTFTGGSQKERQPAYLQAFRSGDDLIIRWQGVGRLGAGAQAAHGSYFTGYRVTIDDGVNDPVIVETTEQEITQSISSFGSEVEISVVQLNSFTGAGPAATLLFSVGGITYPTNTLTFHFGGVVTNHEDVTVSASYTPRLGPSISKNYTIPGSGKASLADYADALATAIDADFPAGVAIVADGDDVVLSTNLGGLSGNALTVVPGSGISLYQEASPIRAGQEQIVFVDLYRNDGNLAPANDAAYKKLTEPYVGGGQINFQINGITQELNASIAFGRNVLVIWDFGMAPSTDNYYGEIYTLAAEVMDPVSGVTDFVRMASTGMVTSFPAIMSRNGVVLFVKDGWRISESYQSWITQGTHASGFKPGVRQIQAPIKAWPAGAKQKSQVVFNHVYDGTTRLTFTEVGQVYYVDLDGVPFEYEADSGDVADSDYFIDAAYEAIKVLIEATGDYTVTLDIGPTSLEGPGVDRVRSMFIERDVINTTFTVAAGVRAGVTVTTTLD